MKKKILLSVLILIQALLYSQVGIGTAKPRGALDINKETTNNMGLVLPTNQDPNKLINPMGGAVAEGTLMYDSAKKCARLYNGTAWSDCLCDKCGGSDPSVSADCSKNGFEGTYKKGTPVSGAKFTVTLTNNSFATVTMAFQPSDLVLSGVDGLTVSAVSPTTANLASGASQMITYTLSGTPATCGTLTGQWKKVTLSCSKTALVAGNPTFNCTSGSWTSPVSPSDYKINGLMSGKSYTGTYTIAYSGGECGGIPSEVLTSNGLTLTYAGGATSPSGTVDYVLSGTYTGPDNGTATFTTSGGCTVYIGPCATCNEILTHVPGTTSGIYWIDPDQEGSMSPMKAQCDMDTDGGGWTLILNYNHKGYSGNPDLNIRSTSLPLLGSTVAGTNESGTVYWGHASNSLVNLMPFTNVRFYGEGNYSGGLKVHFKTTNANTINYIKTGQGSMTGINLASNTFTLPGHVNNTTIPFNLTNFSNNQGDAALTDWPFWTPKDKGWAIRSEDAKFTRWVIGYYPFPYSGYNDYDSTGRDAYSTYHQVWIK